MGRHGLDGATRTPGKNGWEDSSVNSGLSVTTALTAVLALLLAFAPVRALAGELKVISDKTAMGFKFPESVAYDANAKILYVSEFVSEPKPTQKDGKGRISKVGLDGKVIEQRFLPADGQTLNKPKGIWVAGDRLWTTDIDSVWVFDTKTKKGKKVELPGIKFANDPTIIGNVLYVSDNAGDRLYSVEPADFLEGKATVKVVFSGKSINPNGVYPAADGSLLMVGFAGKDRPRGIYSMKPGSPPITLAEGLGRVDGVYELNNGTLLATEWNSGSLFAWNTKSGRHNLADGFKGPADFAVIPNSDGLLVVVPDLVKSELRLIQLGK